MKYKTSHLNGTFVPNHNPELKILAVSLDGFLEHWELLPITGFILESRLDPPPAWYITDWPVTITSLEGSAWCLLDQATEKCYSPAEHHWIGGLPLTEARAELVASLHPPQAH